MKTLLLSLPALLLVGSAEAETVVGEVTGNWAAPKNDGYYYRAILTDEGEFLRLRIYQGMSADAIESEPQFDNARISHGFGRDRLEVGPNGELYLSSLGITEGYAYSERLVIQMMDNQFTATAYEWYNNGPDSASSMPEDPFQCWGEACYSCKADLWNHTAVAGREAVAVPDHDFEALNASDWSPTRIFELGYCPAPD